jgi:hypothetical protein
MITSARIENFKGFSRLELPDLGRVTLLGGRNNVGKTSVLEALFLFYDRMNPNLVHRQFAWRGVSVLPLDPDAVWGPIFREYDLNRPIVISVGDGAATESMEIRCSRAPSATGGRVRRSEGNGKVLQLDTAQQARPYRLDLRYKAKGKKEQVSHLEIRPEGLGLHVEYAESPSRTATFLGARMPVPPSEDATRFGKLDVLGRQDAVVKFLHVIEPRLRGLSSVAMGEQSLVHADVGLGRKIPVAFTGDGMARLLTLVLAIATTGQGVVLIDEVENGLHHSVMEKVWESVGRAAKEFDCQVIATTHSQECLKAAAVGLSAAQMGDDFRYVRLDREQDEVVAKTYSAAMVGAAFERGWEVR